MHCRNNPTAMARRGVTLIELLIVMGILTILATLSLTTVKGLLKDQKITQAARLVEQYIESARVRALTNGRPVAVYLERVSVTGDGSGNVIPTNYMATRLSIGEVFPPYTGDLFAVEGSLADVDFSSSFQDSNGNFATSRFSDGFADQVSFSLGDVVSGFGPGGFVQVGDTIEFVGYNGRFTIEDITVAAGIVTVTFFNPPNTYNQVWSAKALSARHEVFEVTHSRLPPQIPVGGGALSAKFRVYRRPTKSLVGAITLPRGTCVDLAASGFGVGSAGAGADVSSPFFLGLPPSSAAVDPSSYSRIAIMFSGEGRLASVIVENSIAGTKTYFAVEASQLLHLLVGRTEQVVPDAANLSNQMDRKLALLTRTAPNVADPLRSNLLDPGNTWVTCNPFTGEIKSSPVADVSEATLTAVRAAVSADANASVAAVVQAARAFATAGVRNE